MQTAVPEWVSDSVRQVDDDILTIAWGNNPHRERRIPDAPLDAEMERFNKFRTFPREYSK